MPRKTKNSGNSKRRSLIFTESPLNASKAYCSPVIGADHPITADTVQVDDQFSLGWVSPQFDPNSKDSVPRRRRRTTRNRAACSGLSTTSQRPLIRKDAVPGCSNQALTKGFTTLKFVGDKETEASKLSTRENSGPSTRSKRSNIKSRPTVSKCYGGRPMHDSVNQTLNPDEFNDATDGDCQGVQDEGLVGIHEVPPDVDNCKENINTRGLRRSIRTRKKHSSDESLSDSPKFRGKSRTRLPDPEHISSASDKTTDSINRVLMMSPSNLNQEGGCRTRNVSHRLFHEPDTRQVPGRILACDTPEAEYGLRVSLRRRKGLLSVAARNKLLCP